jgi:flagellin-like hook-associated protein FlgL
MADVTLTASVRQSLLSLQNTQNLVSRTQNRLSSGLAVASAIDDAISYFQAKALTDRGGDLLEKKDNIDQGVSTVSTGLDGVTAIEEVVAQMKGVANSMKSAQQSQMSSLINTFNELHTQITNIAGDSTYQGINLINGTGQNLGIEFSDLTASRMDVASVDLRATTAGLDIQTPVTYTSDAVALLASAQTDAGTVAQAEVGNRFLTSADSITLTWNGDRGATFRAGETIDFTYGTGDSLTLYVHTGADLGFSAQGVTFALDVVSTGTTATTAELLYAIATSTRTVSVNYGAVDFDDAVGASWTKQSMQNNVGKFTFTYQGNNAITLTTADNGLILSSGGLTAVHGSIALNLVSGLTAQLVLSGAGDIHILNAYSNATAAQYHVVTTGNVAYLAFSVGASGFVYTAQTTAYAKTEKFGIDLAGTLTSLTGGHGFVFTTSNNVSAVRAGNTDEINNLLSKLNDALTTLRTNAQTLGTNVALLNTRLDFTEDYVNTLQSGSDKLTLADINVEGANLLALQTRQQLGIQALSLAAQAEASILRLFG